MGVAAIKGKMTPALPSGTIIDGRYELKGLLGVGGFAMVYRGEHLPTGREVALKLLNAQLPESHAEVIGQRFLREARVMAGFEHPHVVPIYDSGVHEPWGQPYMAMKRLEGEGLDRVLAREGGMAPTRAWRLLEPCLEALSLAHARGIIHKDLKPANLFMTGQGEGAALVLLDFGAATLLGLPDGRLTQNSEMIGTPQYLAPEYIREHEVTAAVDVYQAALLLVELLTGRPAVGDANAYICLMAHCRGELEVPPWLLDGPLGPALERALALDPAERTPDAGALLEALRAVDWAAVSGPEGASSEAAAGVEGVAARGVAGGAASDGASSVVGGDSGAGSVAAGAALGAVPETVVFEREAPASRVAPRRVRPAAWLAAAMSAAALMCLGSLALVVGAALASEGGARAASVRSAVSAPGAEARPSSSDRGARRSSGTARGGDVEVIRAGGRHAPGAGSRAGRGAGLAGAPRTLGRLEALAVADARGSRGSRGADAALDGDPGTGWRSSKAGWIELELDAPARLAGVVLVPAGAQADASGPVQVRVDGRLVKEVHAEQIDGVVRLALGAEVEARRVRLSFPRGARLGEVQLWGRAAR